ncbi:MAG: endonuclease III [Atopobiaceae bacterium]|nr:endonuclease III [Atopobiaceae bacterium]
MPRESLKSKTARAVEVCRRLSVRYPEDKVLLDHTSPFTLVIAVLLSAQTTDAAVNKVTPELFSRWPDPQSMASASEAELGQVIRSIGFWRTKAAHCIECAQMIVSDFGGEVPQTMEELTRLPGVGRKTANVVLSGAFGIVEGIAVDTHVFRISTRLKLTNAPTPAQAETDLLRVIPRELWGPVNHNLVRFGREVCDARKPLCDACELAELCPSAFKAVKATKSSKNAKRKAKS